MRFRFFVFMHLLLLPLLFMPSAFAQENLSKEEMEVAEQLLTKLKTMPKILYRPLMKNVTQEDYLNEVLKYVKSRVGDMGYLSNNDIQHEQIQAVNRARKAQVASVLAYDDDFDARVTLEEAERSVLSSLTPFPETPNNPKGYQETQAYVEKNLKFLRALDTDQSGTLNYGEMATLSEQAEKQAAERVTREFQEYFDLDSDQDGKLFVSEVKKQALKVFEVFDRNKDGYIVKDEYGPYKWALEHYGQSLGHSPNQDCSVRAVSEDMKLLAIGLHSGKALSTVTTYGQDRETTSVSLKIDDDQRDLYLILGSYTPVIWNFSGNTHAVKYVAVTSAEANQNFKSASGVTGIDQDKVVFLGKSCLPDFYDKESLLRVRGVIQTLFGRFPTAVHGNYEAVDVIVSGNQVSFPRNQSQPEDRPPNRNLRYGEGSAPRDPRNPNDIPTPEGYDPELWLSFLRYYPAGLVDIDPLKVVSDLPAERYEVLPQMAGIAKLVSEGAIVKISEQEFRIVKDIPRFPPGLFGGHAVKFVIGAGVRIPKGDPGHSCVVMQETGRPMGDSALCP